MLIIDENSAHIDESAKEAVMNLTIAVIATYKKISDERGKARADFVINGIVETAKKQIQEGILNEFYEVNEDGKKEEGK